METEIKKNIERLEPYSDRIFLCPLTNRQIRDLEVNLGVSFPDSFRVFLSLVGVFQDLCPNFIQTQADLKWEREFILRTVKMRADIYFAFAQDGYGNLQVLKTRDCNDETIFTLSHISGRLKSTKVSFTQLVEKAVSKAIRQYKRLKPNTAKKWSVQFTITCRSEAELFEKLHDHFRLEGIDPFWSEPDVSPAGVVSRTKEFQLNDGHYTLTRLEHATWTNPDFFFNMEEPAMQLQKQSQIERLHHIFTDSGLNYKLVNYGIL